MKYIFILSLFLTYSSGYTNERFPTAEEQQLKLLSELSENLEKISLELQQVNQRQIQIVKVLTKISFVAEQYRMDIWENQTALSSVND